MERTLLQLLLWGLLLPTACQKEWAEPQLDTLRPAVNGVTIGNTAKKAEPREFWIKFEKPTPCHKLKEVNVSFTGLTVNYDVILYTDTYPCQSVYSRLDSVKVTFVPQQTGEHTLNFLLNNRLYLMKKVMVNP
jgi:hypothetical protein